MKTKSLLIFAFLWLAVQHGFSQRIFKGEIVTTENDTLRGEVWFGLSGKMPVKTKLVYFSETGQKIDRFKVEELVSMSLVHDLTLNEYLFERLDTMDVSYLYSRSRKSNAPKKNQRACCTQKYKGIFAGINISSSSQDQASGAHLGWHIGYAVRGNLQKKVVPQLELLLSSEGFKTDVGKVHIVLTYIKLPVLLNCQTGYKANPFRLLFGLQPTVYMGGYAKRGERLYNPSHIFDNNTYVQPGIEIRRRTDGKIHPGLWNVEGVAGFEVLGKRLTYSVRINAGFLENNRFRNTSLSFRIGI